VAVIEYEFNFRGRSFKSSHWRVGNYTIGNEEGAEAVTSRYPTGSPVRVFVNQSRPLRSVLEANNSSLCWLPFGFGIFLLAVLLLGLVKAFIYE